eukprot:scaffold16428_cov108-Isochrysis_galbana.AAC.1
MGHSDTAKKNRSIRCANGRMRMRHSTIPWQTSIASRLPFPPLPLPFPPARDLLSQVYAAVGGGWALCST